ncbi:MAG TPA: hypothetical protein VE967_14280 [Gemmatimonadaceae bacterium]|nr:hypothetical protein [Gemmatimonadaceae bacterium]
MNCDTVLPLLLEADLEELAGRGTSAVAAHVQECATCAAVARRLLGDTHALAARLERRRLVDLSVLRAQRPRARHVLAAGMISLAACTVIFLAAGLSVRARMRAGQVVSGVGPGGRAPGAPPPHDPSSRSRRDSVMDIAMRPPAAHEPARNSATPFMYQPVRFAAAVPVAPAAYPPVAPADSASGAMSTAAMASAADGGPIVRVDPPPGQRFVVMQRPGVTVVWFYGRN